MLFKTLPRSKSQLLLIFQNSCCRTCFEKTRSTIILSISLWNKVWKYLLCGQIRGQFCIPFLWNPHKHPNLCGVRTVWSILSVTRFCFLEVPSRCSIRVVIRHCCHCLLQTFPDVFLHQVTKFISTNLQPSLPRPTAWDPCHHHETHNITE